MSDERTLSHVDDEGSARMVDVGEKSVTRREARASAFVRISTEALELIDRRALPKGDVFSVARVAGVMAAKQTPSLIPLTHPLALTFIDVVFARVEAGIEITSTVRCEGKTGVEVEALTACSIAALTVYDMCKSADPLMVIERIQLDEKSGGKRGLLRRS